MNRIEITFPVDVDPPPNFYSELSALLHKYVCHPYNNEHPDRHMWVFSQGAYVLRAISEDKSWDVYHVEVDECSRLPAGRGRL